MTFQNPSVQDFKNYYFRDFPYGTDIETSVTDPDIAKAFQQTNININQGLFGDQGSYTVAYLMLAAHWLVIDLRMASQGLNGQAAWLEQSKSVGNVSQAFAIPQRILDTPEFAGFSASNYGMKYLQLVLPRITGQMFISYGRTLP